jgi:hypothetical protein
VQVEGERTSLIAQAPSVRLEVRQGNTVLFKPVSASYGFEDGTGSVSLEMAEGAKQIRANTVTLMMGDERPSGKQVKVVLIDAATERILAAIDKVPISIVNF